MQDETRAQDHDTEIAIATIDRHLETAFQNAPVMMHSLDESGRLVQVNRRWSDELGYAPQQCWAGARWSS